MIKTIVVKLQEPLSAPLVALFRPLDHLFFTIPLVLLGVATASSVERMRPDLSILLRILIANVLAMSFAFAINEIEDAEDDRRDPNRKNPVARRMIDKTDAITATFLVASASFALFAFTSFYAMAAGALILVISFFYSYKPVRLKSMPIVDLISHGLMLSGLIFLSSYMAVSQKFVAAIPIFLGVTLISIYGQFYNQIRDFKEDQKAKIKNTTALVGRLDTKRIMYFVALAGILLLFYSFYRGILPSIPLLLTLAITPIALPFTNYVSKRDLRAGLATTNIHTPFLILVNFFALVFLISLFI